MKINYSWVSGMLSRLNTRQRQPEHWERMPLSQLADIPPVHERASGPHSHR